MNKKLRLLFMLMMILALSFGFMHLFIPGYNFARLHIFLYNLATGGTILLYFTEAKEKMSWKVKSFFGLAIIYTLLAFFEIYSISILLGLILSLIVESVRIKKFEFLPWSFFDSKVKISEKFHHAALLCLSMALFIASFAIWNEEYVHLLSFNKLTLNTFFLGYSFPLSLITLSLAFSMMDKSPTKTINKLKISSFWTITLGVITFFIFILMESNVLELIISLTLFTAVSVVLYIYIKLGYVRQQKSFLTSGIIFLLITSITGINYIMTYFYPGSYTFEQGIILHYHAILSLYGWNLIGLSIISRYNDFPIRLHEKQIIALHWFIALVFAPLGYYFKSMAIISIVLYSIFLYFLFFSKGSPKLMEFAERIK